MKKGSKKFTKDSIVEKQIMKIVPNAFKLFLTKTVNTKIDAVKTAISNLQILNPDLPEPESIVGYMTQMEKIHENKDVPTFNNVRDSSIQRIVRACYEEVYGVPLKECGKNQQTSITNNDLNKKVTVIDVDPQEDKMEQDAKQARKEEDEKKPEVKLDIPFSDLPPMPFPEEFDIIQSDIYTFITGIADSCSINNGKITLTADLEQFERLFKRKYERRITA